MRVTSQADFAILDIKYSVSKTQINTNKKNAIRTSHLVLEKMIDLDT
jgi:hypothetical protein